MIRRLFCTACLLLVLTSCGTVPLTGRHQLNLIPGSSMMAMSLQQYDEFLKEHKLSTNQEQVEMVRRVGARISEAVERYFAASGLSGQLAGYKWEFNLVEDKQVNAWCMPGGKVVVYTGILPITRTEAGLAVVIGHEVAHALAHHGAERMSNQMAAQAGTTVAAIALATTISGSNRTYLPAMMAAVGAGATVGYILPMSRAQESEADRIGLILMAMAGYDPREAVAVWERMRAANTGPHKAEWLSTHPADTTRIADIRRWLPEAMKYYRPR
jgi:metalloendopeptidase OMA1, mitochondrial